MPTNNELMTSRNMGTVLFEGTIIVPEATPDGREVDIEVYDRFEDALIETFNNFSATSIEFVKYDPLTKELITDECTKYTVVLPNNKKKVDMLKAIAVGIGKDLQQAFIQVTLPQSNEVVYLDVEH